MHRDLAEYDAWAKERGLITWGASLTEEDVNRMHDEQNGGAMGWEDVQKGLADAVKDIREKVVEEPYFGRSLSGPELQVQAQEQGPQWPEAKEQAAEQEHAKQQEHERDQRDQGMER
jgi:hypothetical protein